MEMTNDEIIRKFKANPTKEHIKILAELNAEPLYKIKRILADAGLEPEDAKSKKNQLSEPTLKDKETKVSLKSEPASDKIKPQMVSHFGETTELPEVVVRAIDTRLSELDHEILMLYNQADKLSDEKKVLKAFLRGENYEKNGVHR